MRFSLPHSHHGTKEHNGKNNLVILCAFVS
jgi:hypothetical protein